MLRNLFDLSYSLQSLLLEGVFVTSEKIIEICRSSIGGYFDFLVYSYSYKGFVVVFRSSERLKNFKDVITEKEIVDSLVMLEDRVYYFDFYFFTRRYQRKFVIRVVIKEKLGKEEQRLVNNLVSYFKHFVEIFDENYVKTKIVDVIKDLAELSDIQVVISEVTKVVKELLGVEASSILMKDEKTNELYFRQVDSEKGDVIKEFRIPVGKGIAGKVALTDKPMIVNDVSSSSDFFSMVDEKSGFRTREILAVPIRSLNKLVGVIEAINKSDFTKFSFSDAFILDTIADVSGVILVTASLYEKLEKLFNSIIDSLVKALDARDEYTKGHSERVRMYSIEIGRKLGLGKKELDRLQLSAILHDIGKIGIPDSVLNKPGNLSSEEYEVIKKHPVIGYEILKYVDDFEDVREGVRYHHERFDGKGYPENLKGERIPLFARIIAVADAFDAMTSDRPYRKALPFDVALKEIEKGKGKQFDPEVVDAFLDVAFKFY